MIAQERRFAVNGYQLAAKEWHAGAPLKVLALHGWLDNAASFDVLAPLLKDCHIVALDSPGHGRSDHKSGHAGYQIWDDLLDILALLKLLEWPSCHLLGHSRGAIIGNLLAASMPQVVTSQVLLDAMMPEPVDAADSAAQLGRYLTEHQKLSNKKAARYPSVAEAAAVRARVADMSMAAALPIVERGLRQLGEGYVWRSDPRLRLPSAFKLTRDHIASFYQALKVPTLLLLAANGEGAMREAMIRHARASALIDCQLMAGSHHFHMEPPAADIARRILAFWSNQPAR